MRRLLSIRSLPVQTRMALWALAATTLIVLTPDTFAQGDNTLGLDEPTWSDMFGERLVTIICGAALGFVMGAFFSPALRQFRKFVFIGVAALAVLGALFGPVPWGDFLSFLVSAFLFFGALGFGATLGAKAASVGEERPTSYGSAKWATLGYLREHGVIGDAGFWLGEFRIGRDRVEPLHYTGVRHLLTVAPTRSGKGVSSIIPNLLTYPGSAVIIDPKGENALVTAYRRGKGDAARRIEGMGQDVLLVDPWDIAASTLGMRPARFNPLDSGSLWTIPTRRKTHSSWPTHSCRPRKASARRAFGMTRPRRSCPA